MSEESDAGQEVGYRKDKDALLLRLRKMEGQVRGIAQMVDAERACLDIIQQIAALTAAAREVELLLVEDHLQQCLDSAAGRIETSSTKEMMRLLRKVLRP